MSQFTGAAAAGGASGPLSNADDIFETGSDISKTDSQYSYGNRISQFGFTDMFGQTRRYEERSQKGGAAAATDQPDREFFTRKQGNGGA